MNAELLKEIMNQYNQNRAKWIKANGNDKGFDAWFSQQVKLGQTI